MSSDPPRDSEKAALAGRHIPIPTYDEAISSRAPSPYPDDDAGESSQLLGASSSSRAPARADGYQPPTVESARSSLDSDFLEDFESATDERHSLQREMVQMEVMEAEEETRRGKLLEALKKRFAGWRMPRNPFRGMLHGVSCPTIPELPCCNNAAALVPLYRLAGMMIAVMVVYALFASDALTLKSRMPTDYKGQFLPADVRRYAVKNIDYHKIEHWMEYLSSFSHMAGTQGDFVLANYVEGQFADFKLGSTKQEFDVYLNYPKPEGRRVYMEKPEWTAKLEEPTLDKDRENTPVFHGLSKGGKASGPLIYANFGTKEDFAWLNKSGIDVKGTIVMMRYGGVESDPALKIRAAQESGAVGAILFSDPKAEGWDWPGDAVQRHGLGLRNWVVGDVLTPGWASTVNADRLTTAQTAGLLKIPSLPLSWYDARHLLKAIASVGKQPPAAWTAGIPDLPAYWTGSPDSPHVFLENEQVEEPAQPIWNVFGTVPGIDLRDQRIVVGTHRDAWCFGASNANSGTAVTLEVARILGEMMDLGWRPRRTILFANWDASTYNLIGSTEWVEDQEDSIRGSTLAYINVDAAVTGTEFTAAGSPSFRSILVDILSRLPDPIQNASPLSKLWGDKPLPGLGTAGDYVAFAHHAGIPSIDLSFTGHIIPQHSCYDNFDLIKSKDPDMQYHTTMARILISLILELADTPIAPFNMSDYAVALGTYTADLHEYIDTKSGGKLDLAPLDTAIEASAGYMHAFMHVDEPWMEVDVDGIYTHNDDWSIAYRRSRSIRMSNFDKHLLDLGEGGGVPGREWYRHMVGSPTVSSPSTHLNSVRCVLMMSGQ